MLPPSIPFWCMWQYVWLILLCSSCCYGWFVMWILVRCFLNFKLTFMDHNIRTKKVKHNLSTAKSSTNTADQPLLSLHSTRREIYTVITKDEVLRHLFLDELWLIGLGLHQLYTCTLLDLQRRLIGILLTSSHIREQGVRRDGVYCDICFHVYTEQL